MMSEQEIPTFPMQLGEGHSGRVPQTVALAAYEVYSHVFRPQDDLITGSCRGGFGIGELIAFLYARSFPRNEWRKRVDEALTGLRTTRR